MNTAKPRQDQGELAHRVIMELTKMDHFDDDKLRSLIIDNESRGGIQQYKDAKRYAEEKVLEAIEYAPENQSTRYRLEKLPNLILHLENRRIDYRINKLLGKYLPIAEKWEIFDVHLKLLQFKANLIQRTEVPHKRREHLKVISSSIHQINKKQSDLFNALSLLEELRSIVNDSESNSSNDINTFKKKVDSESKGAMSLRSEVIYLETHSRVSLAYRDLKGYVFFINQLINISEKFPFLFEEERFFKILVYAKSSQSFLLARAHKFSEAIKEIEEMEVKAMGVSFHFRMQLSQSIFLQKLHLARKKLIPGEIRIFVEHARNWYSDHQHLIGDRNFLVFSTLAAESLSIIGDMEKASYWLNYLIGSKPNLVSPNITLPANLWALAIYHPQLDLELFESALRRARRYVKKYQPQNDFAHLWIKLAETQRKEDLQSFSTIRQKFINLLDKDDFKSLKNTFPFKCWIESIRNGTSLFLEVEKINLPESFP